MLQVSPQDNLFLHMESGTTPMHASLVGIYDQHTAPNGEVRFKDIIRTFKTRLHKLALLRQRLVNTPLNLDYPYWIDDPEFDIEFHVRHIALPKPGDWRQLCIQLARLNARPLDMGRPLWEVTVIEGLNNIEGLPKDSFAILTKVHHAVYNRDIGGQLLAAMHDLQPDSTVSDPERPLTVDRVPTNIELLSRATINRAGIIGSYLRVARRHALPAAAKFYKSICASGKPCSFAHAPRTRFNDRLSPHRVFAATSIELDTMNRLRSSFFGARFNDILIAIVAGALHRYLKSKHELPDESLTALFPIADAPQPDSSGRVHRFSYIIPRLFTEIDDDQQRTDRLISHLEQARRKTAWLHWKFADDAARLFPNTLADWLLKSAVSYQNARHRGPFFNVFISSTAGPHIPLYHTGARMAACYGIDTVYDNIGLSHNAFSYNGVLSITINCCRTMMPDPEFYTQCLDDTVQALLKVSMKAPGEEFEQQPEQDLAE